MPISEELLIMKQKILQFYKYYQKWILVLAKFMGVCIGITWINQAIGSVEWLTRFYSIMGIGAVVMFLPTQFILIALMGVITLHLVKLNLVMGALCGALCFATYIFVIRLYPKESLLILVMAMACQLKIPFVVPMLVALGGSISCLIPILAGTVLVNIWHLSITALQSGALTNDAIQVVEYIINNVLKNIQNDHMMFTTMGVATVVYLTIYVLRKQSIDYAPYIAICVGGVVNVLGFLLAIIFLDIKVNIGFILVITALTIAVGVLVAMIKWPSDYGRAESVQFEDENNYYYVRVVPKVAPASTKTPVEEVYTDREENTETEIEAQ